MYEDFETRGYTETELDMFLVGMKMADEDPNGFLAMANMTEADVKALISTHIDMLENENHIRNKKE